jgi:uncharacterized protein YceK
MKKCLLFVIPLIVIAGCATIMHGTKQQIGFSSTPSGATVMVDNSEKGVTPVIVKLSRKSNHIVKMVVPGYKPYEATITRGTSGWVWGNIVFGGLIGLVVDAISGGIYKLKPEQVEAILAKEGASITKDGDVIYVTVVLTPDPSWEKIGALEVAQ